MSKTVEIMVSLATIQEKLQDSLRKSGDPNADLIARKIIENLELTEMGLSQLLQAYLGIEEKTPWVVGDECLVDPEKIHRWNWDEDASIKKYPLHKGCIKGKIKELDLRKRSSVVFEFPAVSSGTEKIVTQRLNLDDIKSDLELTLVRPDMAELL